MADYVNVKIAKKLADEMDRVIKKKLKGFRNRGEFVSVAVREKLKEFEEDLAKPRFEHFNIKEDHATVIDHEHGDKWVDVYWHGGKIFCDYCETHDCEHIRFLLEKEEFRERMEELNVKTPKM